MPGRMWCALIVGVALAVSAAADSYQAPQQVLRGLIAKTDSLYLTQSERNLTKMADNPAQGVAEEGEALFRQKRGPKQVSLEGCDFGQGPGVVDGAYARMPRYFEDAGRVMDLETRLVHCMTTLQGYSRDAAAIVARRDSSSDMMKLQTFVASRSSGYAWNPPMQHPLENAMRDAGEALFYRRAGSLDFSCHTCHGTRGRRLHASALPDVKVPEEWTKAVSLPAWRLADQQVRSSQQQLSGCYRQMRQGEIVPGSDASIAMLSFWTDAARGQPAILPDMKR